LGELGRARKYFTKAFELREHASEREKLLITAAYYANVTEEQDKAAQTYRETLAAYPRDDSAYGTWVLPTSHREIIKLQWGRCVSSCN